ncbi:MAG: threonine/serine exporter family protein, partial [Clostridia bacterium]
VPGLAITNAIRDTLNGDYLSGGARATEAFVVAAAIGIGVGCGLALGSVIFKGAML